jgi:hypothetical protein
MTQTALELKRSMYALGFSEAVPPGFRLAVECDTDVAAAERCPECGHEGLSYLAFFRGPSYRGVCVCPDCGRADEM